MYEVVQNITSYELTGDCRSESLFELVAFMLCYKWENFNVATFGCILTNQSIQYLLFSYYTVSYSRFCSLYVVSILPSDERFLETFATIEEKLVILQGSHFLHLLD